MTLPEPSPSTDTKMESTEVPVSESVSPGEQIPVRPEQPWIDPASTTDAEPTPGPVTTQDDMQKQIDALRAELANVRQNSIPTEEFGKAAEPFPTDQSLGAVNPQNPDPLVSTVNPHVVAGRVAKSRGAEITERLGIDNPDSLEGLAARVAELEFHVTGK